MRDASKPLRRAGNVHAVGREKLTAHFAMLLFAVLIAGSFTLGKAATAVMPGYAINSLRYVLAVAVMAGAGLFLLKAPLAYPGRPWRFLILGLLMAVYMSTMFKALEFTSAVSTGAVFTLMPLLSAGFSWLFLRQTTRPGVLISLVVAAAGAVWVVFRGDLGALLAFDVGQGEMIYFVGVICHAAYAPLLRKFNRGEAAYQFAFWAVAATCLWLSPVGAPSLMEMDFATVPAIAWIAIVYLAVVTTIITFLLLQYASLRLPSSKVLGYGYLTPSFIILQQGLLGHGWVSVSVIAGALATACGLLIMGLLPD